MSPTIKFTQEELAEIQAIKTDYEQITVAFGQLHIKQRELSDIEADLNVSYNGIREKEKAFLNKIVEKYGEGTIDPATGIFTQKATA